MPSTSHSTAESDGWARRGSRAARTGSETVTAADASRAPDARRVATLVAVGLAAGLFSALFGVGGGLIVVPLLIGLLAYDAKVATATSLAAIVFTATFGTLTHGLLGNVDWGMALLIGLPAMVGLQLGLVLKDRISSATLTYGFSVVLLAAAVRVAVG